MDFDPKSMHKDLPQMNFSRTVAEESRMMPSQVDNPTPMTSPFYYPAVVTGNGMISSGYGNIARGAHPRLPTPVGQAFTVNTSSGYVSDPNFSGRICAPLNGLPTEGGDESIPRKKLKFLVSFGGKILPRPSDGLLRYVGGQTRIISVRRNIPFCELVQKLADIYGQNPVIKYQLPDEDLDALVSLSCPDDLENMMDECEKLLERSSDGSSKLRLFLFSVSELNPSGMLQFGDTHDSGKRYVDALNGMIEGNGVGGRIVRKESIASAASTQNSELSGNDAVENLGSGQVDIAQSHGASSPRVNTSTSNCNANEGICEDVGKLNLLQSDQFSVGDPSNKSGNPSLVMQPECEMARGLDLGQSGLEVSSTTSYLPSFAGDMYTLPQAEFPSPQFPASSGSVMMRQNPYNTASGVVPFHLFPSGAPPPNIVPLHGNSIDPFFQLPRAQFVFRPEEYMAGPNIIRVPGHQNQSAYQVHMPPGLGILGGGYVLQHVPLQGHAVLCDELVPQAEAISPEDNVKFDDCLMCQKALPHAHSDSAVQGQRNCSHVHDLSSVSPVPQTLDATRSWPASGVTVNGTLSETTKGKRESEVSAGTLANNGHVAGLPVQNIGVMHENESVLKKVNTEHPMVSVTLGLPTDIGATRSSESQFTQVGTAQVHTVPISHGHHRPTDSYITGQKIRPDISVFYEQSKCPVDMLGREEYLEPKFAQGISITGDMWLGDNFTNPRVDACQKKADNASSVPFTEATLSHGLRPVDLNGAGGSLIPESPGVIALTPEWENNVLSFQQKLPISDIENAPIGRAMPPTSQFPDIVDVHDSSNMFFGIHDPLNLRHDPRTLPPRPSKIPHRKDIFDPFGANGESNLDAISENMATARVVREAVAEAVPPTANGSAEDLIKQELQAVAESVATSVLQSSSPSRSQFPISEPDELLYEGNQGNKARPPEKAHIAFPVSDNRPQIIKNCDLEELRELGSGTFGTVYHGKWRGTDVAIKRINDRCFSGKASEQDRMRSDFWNEAIKLAELHHPNVVAFYGLVLDGPVDSVATVTEFMVNGSLRNVLQKSDKNLDKRKRLLIAMDVAFGMEYLHGKNIVHFDLKSDNLLVNFRDPHRPICKVSDLGLSKVKCQTLISGGVRGTLPWMAPELLNGSSNLVSEKVDVFSYGVVMWELLTGEEPYADLHYGAIIGGIVNNTLRPPVPESCDPDWRSLMEWCWSSEPSDRPTFTEAANHLRSMAAKVPSKSPSHQQHPLPQK